MAEVGVACGGKKQGGFQCELWRISKEWSNISINNKNKRKKKARGGSTPDLSNSRGITINVRTSPGLPGCFGNDAYQPRRLYVFFACSCLFELLLAIASWKGRGNIFMLSFKLTAVGI